MIDSKHDVYSAPPAMQSGLATAGRIIADGLRYTTERRPKLGL